MDIVSHNPIVGDQHGLVELADRIAAESTPATLAEACASLTPLLAWLEVTPGDVWDTTAILRSLRRLGAFDLSVARLFEGHVNALQLLDTFAGKAQREQLIGAAGHAPIFAIWSADDPAARLSLREDGTLVGRKVMCSGAGAVSAAIASVATPRGPILAWLPSPEAERFSILPPWPIEGMEATNSLGFDAGGITLDPGQTLGEADDYLREPAFSGGIWRILAMQLGALDRLADGFATHVIARNQTSLPAQRRRMLENAIDGETAALWVERAAEAVSDSTDVEAALARVALAREVVTGCAERIMARVQRGMGLAAQQSGHPIGRVLRDLNCALRQPGPDLALDRAEPWLHRTSAASRWTR